MKKLILFTVCTLLTVSVFADSLKFNVSPDYTGSKTKISFDDRGDLPTAIKNFSSKRLIAAKIAFTINKPIENFDNSVMQDSNRIKKLFDLSSITSKGTNSFSGTKKAPFGITLSFNLSNYLVPNDALYGELARTVDAIIETDQELAGTEDFILVQEVNSFNMLLGRGFNICKFYARGNKTQVVAYSFIDVTSSKPSFLIGGALKSQISKEVQALKAQIPTVIFN
jgi:hypothetical protein